MSRLKIVCDTIAGWTSNNVNDSYAEEAEVNAEAEVTAEAIEEDVDAEDDAEETMFVDTLPKAEPSDHATYALFYIVLMET